MTLHDAQIDPQRPIAATTRFAACGVVYRWTRDIALEFLIIKKCDHWTLPKGHLLQGESAAEAILREVAEETGVRGVVCGELLQMSYPVVKQGQITSKRLTYFLIRGVDGIERPQRSERITAVRWCSAITALRLIRQSHHRMAVLAAAERLADDVIASH